MNVLVVGRDRRYTGELVEYLNLLDGITASGITTDIGDFFHNQPIPVSDLIILDLEVVGAEIPEILNNLMELGRIPLVLVLTIHPEAGLLRHRCYGNKIMFLSKDLGIDSVLDFIRNVEFNND